MTARLLGEQAPELPRARRKSVISIAGATTAAENGASAAHIRANCTEIGSPMESLLHIFGLKRSHKMQEVPDWGSAAVRLEAGSGIEPLYEDLQSSA